MVSSSSIFLLLFEKLQIYWLQFYYWTNGITMTVVLYDYLSCSSLLLLLILFEWFLFYVCAYKAKNYEGWGLDFSSLLYYGWKMFLCWLRWWALFRLKRKWKNYFRFFYLSAVILKGMKRTLAYSKSFLKFLDRFN